MTVTRVPARNPEPEGLDGRGTTRAADLPASAHVWGHLAAPVDYNDDLEAEAPVRRERCLLVDPDGDYLMPGRCKKPLGHEDQHDWGANHGAFLGETRRAELRDTPSGRLPVRTPGAALASAWVAEHGEEHGTGPGGPGEAARPSDRILGRWAC